jgi:nucleotide-binding universal stress UspA family protein
MDAATTTILVGIDGSACGVAALDWAAAEAHLRGVALTLVHAYPASWVGVSPEYFLMTDPAGPTAPRFVEEALTRVTVAWPRLAVSVRTVADPPAHALVAMSENAALVVVGAHGRSAVGRLLLGSVSQHVATHAHCPAVVVRGTPRDPAWPVAVGLDDSDAARAALAVALDEAALRDVPLLVVHSWQEPPHASYGAWAPPAGLEDSMREAAEGFVAESLAACPDTHPDLDVRARVVKGHPVTAVLEAAHHAQLLVVGSHGRGAFPGMAFGSVTTAALHGSDCPVLVVPRSASS